MGSKQITLLTWVIIQEEFRIYWTTQIGHPTGSSCLIGGWKDELDGWMVDLWLVGWVDDWVIGGVDEWVVEVILQLTKNTCSIQWLLDFHTWFQWLVHLVSGLEISTRWHGANAFWCHLVEMSEKKYMFCVSRINNLIHMCVYIYIYIWICCAKSNVHNMINYI